jgi:hypothetical protein
MPQTVRKLSEEQERALSSALCKVADCINAGEHPNDAIYKIASQDKIPAGHIPLMVNAYNTGRCLSQIRNGKTVLEKAADFPIAHAKDVLERMYPSKVATPAEEKKASDISPEYQLLPRWFGELRKAAQSVLVKEAAECCEERKPIFPAKPYEEGALRQAQKTKNQLTTTASMKKLAAAKASREAIEAYDELQQYFKYANCIPFPEVRENVSAAVGARGARLMDTLLETNKRLTKQAAYQITPVNWSAEPYSLVATCLSAMDRYVAAQGDYLAFHKQAAEQIKEAFRPFARGDQHTRGSIWAPSQEKQADEVSDLTTMGLGAMVGVAGRELGEKLSPDKEKEVNKRILKMEDPYQEDRMNALNTRTMLYDLMVNDPVISGYNPREITQAYNHIREIAPRAAGQRMVAQALLRKYLSQGGAMDPFELSDMLENERRMTMTDAVHPNAVVARAQGKKPMGEMQAGA